MPVRISPRQTYNYLDDFAVDRYQRRKFPSRFNDCSAVEVREIHSLVHDYARESPTYSGLEYYPVNEEGLYVGTLFPNYTCHSSGVPATADLQFLVNERLARSGNAPVFWTNYHTAPRSTSTRNEISPNQETIDAVDRLGELPLNWDGYGADQISTSIIVAAKNFIGSFEKGFASKPHVAPMTGGRLQLEWDNGDAELQLEFETPNRIRFLKWNPSAGIEEEGVLFTTQIREVHQLVRWVQDG